MTAVLDPNLLRQIDLFQGLGLVQLAQLNRLLRSADLPAGKRFLAADQPGEAVYVILSGTVKVFDYGALETGDRYITMELVSGQDLATKLQRGPLPLRQVYDAPLAAPDLAPGIDVPSSVRALSD